MSDERVAQLFDEASAAGLRITGLDGWTQTRLAGSLKIRREVINAIINRDPVAEPSDSRPRMVEACREIIAFAAVISRKEDAVLPREVDPSLSLDDDAQAYETHKLRLRRLVEDAIGGGAFIEGMFRVGELSSQAVHAPPRFRVQMIGNVVTAIQRLLDKPQSRSIPADLVANNLRRLTLAEWAARRVVRALPAGDGRTKAADDLAYIRGQVGYAMMFSGLLASADDALRRGRRRLWRAATRQPSPDYGHWSNLLRAINDLLSNGHAPAGAWAGAAVDLAQGQQHPGFSQAFTRLRDNGELVTLINYWQSSGVMPRVTDVLGRGSGATQQPKQSSQRRKTRKGATAAAVLLLVSLLMAPSAARAGDGKELAAQRGPGQGGPAPRAASPALSRSSVGGGVGAGVGGGFGASVERNVIGGGAGGGRGNGPIIGPAAGMVPGRASVVAPRFGEVPSRRPSLFQGRQGAAFARGVEQPAIVPADSDAAELVEAIEEAFAVPSGLTRAGGLAPIVPTRTPARRPVRLYDEAVDAGPPLARNRDRDVEESREEMTPAPATTRPNRSAAPARSGNRRFPLIVVRDVKSDVRTRTIPRTTQKNEVKSSSAPDAQAIADDAEGESTSGVERRP